MSCPPAGSASAPASPAAGPDAAAAADRSTHADATRRIPGPRVRRAPATLPLRTGRLLRHRPGLARLPARLASLRRPALSSALAACALAGSGVLILHLVQRQTGTTGLLVGLALAILPLPFVLGSLAWLNRTARVPLRHILFCLAWGACAATTVAIMANGWASDFLIAHQGPARGETLVAEFATPLIEESAKAAALLLLLLPFHRRLRCRTEDTCALLAGRGPEPGARRPGAPPRRARARLRPLPYFRPAPPGSRARSSPRTLTAGTLLGSVTACGFAFTENALYLGRAFTDDQQARLDNIGLGDAPSLRDFDSTVHTFVLRGLLSPFAHPLFTALTGLGVAVALTTARRWTARLAAPGGLLLAITLHGSWNAAAGLGTDGFLLVYALVMVPCFAALVCFAVWARTRASRQPARPVTGAAAAGAAAETGAGAAVVAAVRESDFPSA
ncbi:PrsW family intramembrane metalloprotease [Kitasatospora sp. NPDC048540]|uniref:PrsW family intramembrane metalloprotease n=1 Tax=Kitasatospora sp. NPDC048540 TaxID=3155634 RepID=UPI0033CDA8E8